MVWALKFFPQLGPKQPFASMALWSESPFPIRLSAAVVHTYRHGISPSGRGKPTAKHVVSMLAQPQPVHGAEDKRLLDAVGPHGLIVKLCRVPDDFQHQLRDPDGVGGRAGTSQAEEGGRTVDRVRDVILVVGAVEIFAVPAARQMVVLVQRGASCFGWRTRDVRREVNVAANPTRACLLRQRFRVDAAAFLISSSHQVTARRQAACTYLAPPWQGAAVSPPKLGPV